MKTLMQPTSLETYHDLRKEGRLGPRQKQVYEVLETLGPHTNQEIARIVELPINCVTGRVKELRDIGLVEEKKKILQANHRSAIVWGVVPEEKLKRIRAIKGEQGDLFGTRS